MSYTKIVPSAECYRGQFNETRGNKEFVQLRNVLCNEFADYVIARMCGIATSTFTKIKLGYYQPTSAQLTSLRNVTNNICDALADLTKKTASTDNVKSVCTRKSNEYVVSPSVQSEKVTKVTDHEETRVITTDKNTVTINVPANFGGNITINVN